MARSGGFVRRAPVTPLADRHRSSEEARRAELEEVPSHLLAIKDVSDQYLELLLTGAKEMKHLVETQGGDDRLNHTILALAFYEVGNFS